MKHLLEKLIDQAGEFDTAPEEFQRELEVLAKRKGFSIYPEDPLLLSEEEHRWFVLKENKECHTVEGLFNEANAEWIHLNVAELTQMERVRK